MADTEGHATPISQQLEDLAHSGKPASALRLERELERLSKEPDTTGLR